jgi:hypothetical protein
VAPLCSPITLSRGAALLTDYPVPWRRSARSLPSPVAPLCSQLTLALLCRPCSVVPSVLAGVPHPAGEGREHRAPQPHGCGAGARQPCVRGVARLRGRGCVAGACAGGDCVYEGRLDSPLRGHHEKVTSLLAAPVPTPSSLSPPLLVLLCGPLLRSLRLPPSQARGA